MITGTTQLFGVMGSPIEHTLSPAIHTAGIASVGMNAVYLPLSVEKAQLAAAVKGAVALGFVGWNVTIPHKRAIMEFLDEITEDAEKIGAVNTIVRDGGRLIGHNTDVAGVLAGLSRAGVTVQGKQAVILGAGGAARAVLWGLICVGAERILIAARSGEKAEKLAAEFHDSGDVRSAAWTDKIYEKALETADIIVNTTPLGMTPNLDVMPHILWEKLKSDAVLYDVIYTPRETRFLREGRERGHLTVNGEDMLTVQGAKAFELWTGKYPNVAAMRHALRRALELR